MSDIIKQNLPASLLISDRGLQQLNVRPPLPLYLKQLWQRRHFIFADARSKSFSAGRDMFLGRLWILIDPVLQVSIYAVVFGLILQITRGIDNFIGFLVIGVIFFRTATRGIAAGSGLISKSRSVISSFQFPKASLAFSVNLRNAIDDIVPVTTAVVVALLFQPSDPISWTVLLALPAYVIIYIFCTGATLVTAWLTAFIPDLKGIIALLNRGLFFVSGVFFSIERYATHPLVQDIMQANPIYQFLRFVRIAVLDGQVPPMGTWLYLLGFSSALFLVGFILFWSAEESYSNVK